ncbi:MAG: rhodanese-like domain-containing protein [Coriobacteriia bacterium]|nr:rhodanese-like domain-containing protein [Coriobacteriia bacterium]
MPNRIVSTIIMSSIMGLNVLSSSSSSTDIGAQPPQAEAGPKAVYRKTSPADAYQMMSESPDFTIVDVRDPEEFKEFRIDGAINIPLGTIADQARTMLPDLDQLVFVHCLGGKRSEQAAKALVGLGYTQVHDIGGINDWPYGTVSN